MDDNIYIVCITSEIRSKCSTLLAINRLIPYQDMESTIREWYHWLFNSNIFLFLIWSSSAASCHIISLNLKTSGGNQPTLPQKFNHTAFIFIEEKNCQLFSYMRWQLQLTLLNGSLDTRFTIILYMYTDRSNEFISMHMCIFFWLLVILVGWESYTWLTTLLLV